MADAKHAPVKLFCTEIKDGKPVTTTAEITIEHLNELCNQAGDALEGGRQAASFLASVAGGLIDSREGTTVPLTAVEKSVLDEWRDKCEAAAKAAGEAIDAVARAKAALMGN